MTKPVILTVDDSVSIRKMIVVNLENAGYTVMEAGDGVEAIGKLAKVQVDLIITDLNMPNMDGLSLLEHLRTDPKHRFTPILLLTTESDFNLRQKGKGLGANGWIVKPFKDIGQLLRAVHKFLPKGADNQS
ncbi:MAG: response regulator [Magnetococcales bacterium]|nr:response regulator [Magnetococcales bacterium]MBF0321672.1 response regulator [Magnetococcales bacterium]